MLFQCRTEFPSEMKGTKYRSQKYPNSCLGDSCSRDQVLSQVMISSNKDETATFKVRLKIYSESDMMNSQLCFDISVEDTPGMISSLIFTSRCFFKKTELLPLDIDSFAWHVAVKSSSETAGLKETVKYSCLTPKYVTRHCKRNSLKNSLPKGDHFVVFFQFVTLSSLHPSWH